MKKHYKKIIADNDLWIEQVLNHQVLKPHSEFYGGFYDPSSLVEPKYAIYQVANMTACLFNSESRYYGSQEIFQRLVIALEYIKQGQRENGFFDLINCNFYSGADTAFCLDALIPPYVYLKKLENNQASVLEKNMSATLLPIMETILIRGGNALLKGGFHTPNHRWAIASVLMMLYRLTSDEAYKKRSEEFLIEGCDCNEDGEYAERSAGGYNRVNNDAMIMLAVASQDESYYEPVKRNLTMMLTYIEPDGTIFTNNSTRQDRGSRIYPIEYYMEYLYMGIKFNNDAFLKAACYIMDLAEKKGMRAMSCLIHFMLQPELVNFEYDESSVLTDYCRLYNDSGIVRFRRDQYSCSIIKGSPSFLYFQHGDLCVSMNIGAGFCEHRNFIGDSLTRLEDGEGYQLKQKMTGWYYLPFQEPQDTTDWWQMDHSKREKLLGPDMLFDITILEVDHGIDVKISVNGIDRAPLRVELAFDKGCRVESNAFIARGCGGEGIVVKEGTVTASKGDYAITAGPGFGAHNYVDGKFGSQGRSTQCFTVYFTDFTCFEHTISLRAVPALY